MNCSIKLKDASYKGRKKKNKMPDCINNTMIVSGDTEQLLKFKDAVNFEDDDCLLKRIDGRFPGLNSELKNVTENECESLKLWFDSKWAQSLLSLLDIMSIAFPLLVFEIDYDDMMRGIRGFIKMSNGEVLDHNRESYDRDA